MNDNLRRALEALESGVREVRAMSARSASEARARIRQAMTEADQHLGPEVADDPPIDDDIFAHLDRQSRDIADDLRRVEELMRKRTGRE